jgi:hypothetical protein
VIARVGICGRARCGFEFAADPVRRAVDRLDAAAGGRLHADDRLRLVRDREALFAGYRGLELDDLVQRAVEVGR